MRGFIQFSEHAVQFSAVGSRRHLWCGCIFSSQMMGANCGTQKERAVCLCAGDRRAAAEASDSHSQEGSEEAAGTWCVV